MALVKVWKTTSREKYLEDDEGWDEATVCIPPVGWAKRLAASRKSTGSGEEYSWSEDEDEYHQEEYLLKKSEKTQDVTEEQILKYYEESEKTQGFEIDHLPPLDPVLPLVRTVRIHKMYHGDRIKRAARLAIDAYNRRPMKNELALVEILKANMMDEYFICWYFITLKAVDKSTKKVDYYQTCVLLDIKCMGGMDESTQTYKPSIDRTKVEIFRPARNYNLAFYLDEETIIDPKLHPDRFGDPTVDRTLAQSIHACYSYISWFDNRQKELERLFCCNFLSSMLQTCKPSYDPKFPGLIFCHGVYTPVSDLFSPSCCESCEEELKFLLPRSSHISYPDRYHFHPVGLDHPFHRCRIRECAIFSVETHNEKQNDMLKVHTLVSADEIVGLVYRIVFYASRRKTGEPYICFAWVVYDKFEHKCAFLTKFILDRVQMKDTKYI